MSFWTDFRDAAKVVIAGIAAFYGFYGVALVLLADVYGRDQRRKAERRALQDYNASLKDRYQMVRSATAPRRVVYGRARVSGPIVYAQSTGTKKEFLHILVALAGHECDAIETVYLNDIALPAEDGAGFVQSGEFARVTDTFTTEGFTATSFSVAHVPQTVHLVTRTTNSGGTGIDAQWTTETLVLGVGYTRAGAAFTIIDGGGWGTDGITVNYDWRVITPRVRVKKFLGTAGQAASSDLITESGGVKWTSAHQLKGICYLYLRLEYDQDIFAQVGLPNISAVVRGKKVYDTRDTVTRWSENAALCTADYLKDTTYGLRASSAEVPSAETTTAANICDQAVLLYNTGTVTVTSASPNVTGVGTSWLARVRPRMNFVGPDAVSMTVLSVTDDTHLVLSANYGGATLGGQAYAINEARYTCNGVLDSADTPRNNLDKLQEAMANTVLWTQGRWLLRAGAHLAPSLTITADMLGDMAPQISPRAPRQELVNRVIATYAEPEKLYTEMQAPAVANATYLADDGSIDLPVEVTYDMATGGVRAQRLAKIHLERQRQALSVRLSCNLLAYDLAPSDVVALTLTRYGWSAKLFEVVSRGFDLNTRQMELLLRETASGVWDWALGSETAIDLTPNTDLPSPFTAPASLAGLSADSSISNALLSGNGSLTPRVRIAWTQSTDVFVVQGGWVEIEFKSDDATDWSQMPRAAGSATSAYLSPVQANRLILIRVRPVNSRGRVGAWTVQSHLVSLGSTAGWAAGVSGSGKPADNATKNTVTYSASAPGSPTDGDIWVDTTSAPTISKYRISGAWQIGANYVTNTTQVTDGANLGGTATWTGVSGAGKPSDNATKNTSSTGTLAARPATNAVGDTYYATDTNLFYACTTAPDTWTVGASKNAASSGTLAARPTTNAAGDTYYATDMLLLYLCTAAPNTWNTGANNYTNSTLFTDGAGWSTTATWTGVSGAGKPADNATVGATLGTNVSGQIDSGNVATLVADDAIPSTKVSSVNADKINAGSIRGINTQSAAFMTKGTFLVGVPAAGAATVNVGNTADFAASGTFIVADLTNDRDVVVYTGKTSTSFTGCTTTGANAILGSHTDGASVVPLLKNMVIDDTTNEMRFYGDRGDGVIEELASVGINTAGDTAVSVLGSSSTACTRVGLLALSGTKYAIDAFNTTTEASGIATIRARNNSSGRAIEAASTSGFAILGAANGSYAALYGSNSSSGTGVEGFSTSGYGVFGHVGSSSVAVYGENTSTGVAVSGKGTSSGQGVKGESSTGYGGEFVGNSTKGSLLLTPRAAPSGKAQGAMYVDSGDSHLYVGNGSIWQKVALVADAPPPPPTCFPAGARVLLADGSWKLIQRITTEDLLWGPHGPVKVVRIDRPLLGSRRMMKFADGHTWSEEHAHWTRAPDLTQWWWTVNKKLWLSEVESGEVGGLFDNDSIRTGDLGVEFAHIDGWKTNQIMLSREFSNRSRLYLPVTDGSPIIVNGYVCGACVNQRGFDYTQFDWNDALTYLGATHGH